MVKQNFGLGFSEGFIPMCMFNSHTGPNERHVLPLLQAQTAAHRGDRTSGESCVSACSRAQLP